MTYKTWITHGADMFAEAGDGITFFSVNPNCQPAQGIPTAVVYGTIIVFKGVEYPIAIYFSVLANFAIWSNNNNEWTPIR